MSYFLAKADPDHDYSIDDLARDGQTIWDGVHNNAALLAIRAMHPGDYVYIYHSQKQKAIVGLAQVVGEPYFNEQDPRKSWAVELRFVEKYQHPLSLNTIKQEPAFTDFALVRQSRLSVMPISPAHQQLLASLL
jgi:predicted RNA-binding protein with PUA-like domain